MQNIEATNRGINLQCTIVIVRGRYCDRDCNSYIIGNIIVCCSRVLFGRTAVDFQHFFRTYYNLLVFIKIITQRHVR